MIDWEKYKREKDTMSIEEKSEFLKSVVNDECEPCIIREAAALKLLGLVK